MIAYLALLNTDQWTAVAAISQGLAAVGAFIVAAIAYWQISHLRNENKKERTFSVCERYDLDPVLSAAAYKLKRSRPGIARPLRIHKAEIVTILNYLEQVAMGVGSRGAYDRWLVCEYLGPIMQGYKASWLDTGLPSRIGLTDEFGEIVKLCEFIECEQQLAEAKWLYWPRYWYLVWKYYR